MIRKTSFILAALLCGALALTAQTDGTQAGSFKYGHMNLGNLLAEMPETAVAEAQLRVMADSLNAKDSLMTAAFQEAYLTLKKQYDGGELTAQQVQQRQVELEKQRQAIEEYEKTAQAALETKRGDLLGPILSRVEEAIKAVAKENGFAMIFDVGTGSMLFASETIDVLPMVKKKLGM